MKDLKVIFFGTPEFINPIRQVLAESFDLILSVDNPDQLNDALISQLSSLKPDLFVVAAFGKIISKKVLDIPKYGVINVHPSLLPRYRGATPIQQAILDGVDTSGITIMLMDEGMDHGPILFQEEFRFSQKDNFDTLSKSMFQKASEKLKIVIIEYINGSISPVAQDNNQATLCKMIKKEDGFFDIDPPAPIGSEPVGGPPSLEILDRMIRAYYPWPTAFTHWRGKIVKFLPNNMIQMEGKRPTDLKSFLNGYPDFPIKHLVV